MVTEEVLSLSPRQEVFQEFWKATGFKKYSPEFYDSLIATMIHSDCLTERIHAWSKWRSWANSSIGTVVAWNDSRPLGQIDCIVDLTWFEQGQTAEWIARAPESDRQKAREEAARKHLKPMYSRAFGRLVESGRIVIRGRQIYPVFNPPKPAKKVAPKSNYFRNEAYLAWLKVAHYDNFQEFEVAEEEFRVASERREKAREVVASLYREFQDQTTSDPSILSSVIQESNTAAATDCDQPEMQPQAAAAEPPPETNLNPPEPSKPAPPTPEETHQVQDAMSEYGPCDFDTAEKAIVQSREMFADATAEEVVQMISEKGQSMIRRPTRPDSPIGFLLSTVARGFRGYRRKQEAPPVTTPSPPKEPACKICDDSGLTGTTGADLAYCSCAAGTAERQRVNDWLK